MLLNPLVQLAQDVGAPDVVVLAREDDKGKRSVSVIALDNCLIEPLGQRYTLDGLRLDADIHDPADITPILSAATYSPLG